LGRIVTEGWTKEDEGGQNTVVLVLATSAKRHRMGSVAHTCWVLVLTTNYIQSTSTTQQPPLSHTDAGTSIS
jgi:hypothetical protein